MNKDKEIEELFKNFNPDVNAERIMFDISGKMDVIDMVRPEQDRMDRFHRTVSLCCFIVGLLAGSLFMILLLLHPSAGDVMLDFALVGKKFPEFTRLCTGHRDVVLIFLTAVSFILGSLPLINSNEWGKYR